MLGRLRFLAHLSQQLLGRSPLPAGLVVPVACLWQQCVGGALFGMLPSKPLTGHRGRLASLGERPS
ncbi:hypothetical protein [Streptomyces sp900116325]|uniref:hypothetical protein n=1 Tax=Streptomyces sp. 900116325 TaxID=3154295 RepID=UPI0033B3183C